MLAIRDLVQKEIERLRKEGELLRSQAKDRFQKAEELERQLAQISSPDLTVPEEKIQREPKRGARADLVVQFIDGHPEDIFTSEALEAQLGFKVDPGLLSRLKKDGRIAKAKATGYCSTKSSESLKEETADTSPQLYGFLGEQSMTD